MSEEGLEPITPEIEPEAKVDELPQWAKEEMSRLRGEAAGRRVANKEKDKELDEYRSWKEQQKSELERQTERATKAEQDLAELRLGKLREDIAKEVGLDPDLADRIRGESKDELLKDAKAMVEKVGKHVAPADPSFLFGSAAKPARGKQSTSEQFNNWLHTN